MTTTYQNLNHLAEPPNYANASDRARALAVKIAAIRANYDSLTISLAEAEKALQEVIELFEAELVTRVFQKPWQSALTGIAKTPAANPGPPMSSVWNTPNPSTVTAPAVGKPVNLTDEARKLINTGHSYEGAIKTLVAKHPDRAREHIRRAVGRANGGKA